jgi:16S rRNA processing protein RimM
MVRVLPLTDFPQRFRAIREVWLQTSGKLERMEVEASRLAGNRVILKLAGIDTPEQARRMRGAMLQVPRQELQPLEEGAFYRFEIVGLSVFTLAGSLLGVVTEVLETGGNDVYVVRDGSGGEILIPALKSVIKKIDTEAGQMVIEPLPGLLD